MASWPWVQWFDGETVVVSVRGGGIGALEDEPGFDFATIVGTRFARFADSSLLGRTECSRMRPLAAFADSSLILPSRFFTAFFVSGKPSGTAAGHLQKAPLSLLGICACGLGEVQP